MAAPMLAPMPQLMDLDAGYTLRVTALDPSTGALVAGVTIGEVTIQAADLSDAAAGPTPLPDVFLAHLPTSG